MISILGAGCSTAAGTGVAPLMAGLHAGSNFLTEVDTTNWLVKPAFAPRAYRWSERPGSSVRALLGSQLSLVLDEALAGRTLEGSYGVILASTKGFTEDFVWNDGVVTTDPLTPLLDDVISNHRLNPAMRICVSNACASSLAALSLAKMWLSQLDHVIVLACDAIDSFVLHGFSQLRVLTTDLPRPFSDERSGFYLGDGAACVILSSSQESDIQLIDATFDSEGYAVTRPSLSGESLLRACRKLQSSPSSALTPDLVVAHGTATRANDETEDRVFSTLFEKSPPITGTKWMIGHTLGVCGLIDTIVASESLRAGRAPALMTTEKPDATFKGGYVTGHSRDISAKTALITSLGLRSARCRIDRSNMTICLNTFQHACEFPATETPEWAPKVDRWYQLDQPAYSIAQSYSRLDLLSEVRPDVILLASPGASNETDRSFAVSGAASPSKFVHTLPNIRGVPLLQVMQWSGPLLCVQNDPNTVKAAVEQALLYFETSPHLECIWVVSFGESRSTFHVLTRRMWGPNPRLLENRQQALEQL